MGMPSDEYWNGPAERVIAYRKAAKLRAQMDNERAWVQGKYIYDALCLVQPIYNPFAKSGTEPLPWPKCPYGMGNKPEKTEPQKSDLQQRFEIWAAAFNEQFKRSKEEESEVRKDG